MHRKCVVPLLCVALLANCGVVLALDQAGGGAPRLRSLTADTEANDNDDGERAGLPKVSNRPERCVQDFASWRG
ncbi:hypothetical protein PHYSODRAFT_494593 [Phytophthora sojae]|uniref:RxLR effector protein n=1 Tax=Phytophthora sojae (strain P6497) TaxID=1094619 RepID=G4Z631_PHYSP|nr:hypothetical protein PHYSODRAFT_494593 [Phytophthora sojae]EGZ20952.1 hypothetical protein PHYSODRAFT_494593 [Phytophthora sojae]|eukprot:XP_009523669.1 hypothetical protein PHYSODRAFT_494593 [Phytophthora sojae]